MAEENKRSGMTPEDIAQIAAQAAASVAVNATRDKAVNANEAALVINNKVRDRQVRQQNYANRISAEMDAGRNCTTIIIPEIYRRWQPSFTVSINGCTISLKPDGKPHVVHNDFAIILLKRMQRLSQKIDQMNSPDISEYSRN